MQIKNLLIIKIIIKINLQTNEIKIKKIKKIKKNKKRRRNFNHYTFKNNIIKIKIFQKHQIVNIDTFAEKKICFL